MSYHIPILTNEIVDRLKIKSNGVYMDCTMGFGGHSESIVKKLNSKGNLIGIDLDPYALKMAKEKLEGKYKNIIYSNSSYIDFPDILNSHGIKEVDGFLFDLGISSYQVDSEHRGFSYRYDSDLDMRMDQLQKLTAYEVVNDYPEDKLIHILKLYSEDKFSKKIAKAIVNSRPISGTKNLVEVIKNALPKQNPIYTNKTIRRVFQALRIEVNNELNEIKTSLEAIKNLISKDGVIVCISYHSLEDKIVKHFFNELSIDCICQPIIPVCNCNTKQEYVIPKKKKFVPTDKEIKVNPRSKSAIMRYVVKL